ncbi:hypothetical protein GQ53DRAFT_728729 [Thozetella sp. PMI_491]|nr:hypothetical protein GQ53DRAFT_728729 [Thozetella sp. PMI_491]
MATLEETDVLVCGAGPVGLLTALGLAQQGVDTIILEKRERAAQASRGRASFLYSRSIELLEQLDLADPMTQEGFIAVPGFNWNNGRRVTNRPVSINVGLPDTFHEYALSIRQSNSEDIFYTKYATDFGKKVWFGWALVDFTLDSSQSDDYNLTAKIEHRGSGEKKSIRCKYIVGADGGQSTVRQRAGIAMQGSETEYQWIRVDGKFKTDLPDADLGVTAVETKSHGSMLYQKLNRDMHRVGLTLSPALREKYRHGVTEEQAVEESIEAMKPFKLEVERVDWFTLYSIKQKVAATMQHSEFVLLAGDAAHTHSSAFAQGMNTGVHDATNLSWKLAGVIRGWYRPCLLETYDAERRPVAQKLIEIDQDAAAAMSGTIPPKYGGPEANINEVVQRIWKENAAFGTGFGISYGASAIVGDAQVGCLHPGSRIPDTLIRRPGLRVPFRLHEATRASGLGRWSILVFAGYPSETKERINALREALETKGGLVHKRKNMLNLFTLSASPAGSAWVALGGPAIGRLFFDVDGYTHLRYGISWDVGGVAVIRPDGILALTVGLDAVRDLESFFDTFCV